MMNECTCGPDWETPCPKSPDDKHCVHWYDAEGPCCYCKDDPECAINHAEGQA